MYGKIFESIYESTVADNWRALVTMQQLITLADHKGEVHHSLRGLHRRTGIPLDVLEPGLEILLSSDPNSQSKKEGGRRILPLPEIDGRQPIGWQLVNYAYYRDQGSRYENKEKAKIRKQNQRGRENKCDMSQPVTVSHASHGYTDTDTDTNQSQKTMSGKPDPVPNSRRQENKEFKKSAREILEFLNQKTGKAFKPVDANLDLVIARLKEGYTEMEMRQVIVKQNRKWGKDEEMSDYLRPKTLFNKTNLANYVGELVVTADG